MQYPIEIPPLAAKALTLAESLGFDIRPEGNPASAGSNTAPSCCINEAGALLKTLASTVTAGTIGEIGTGGRCRCGLDNLRAQPGINICDCRAKRTPSQ